MNAAYTYIIIFIFLCLIGYIYYGYRSNEIRNKQILNELDRKSAHNSYAVFLLADLSQKCSLTDSKIGGIPYWDFSKQAYPVNDKGEYLLLLAQINLEQMRYELGENIKACAETDILPKTGILQFFVDDKDELLGLDFNDMCHDDGFRVVFHRTIDNSITEESISNQIKHTSTKGNSNLINGETKVNFRVGKMNEFWHSSGEPKDKLIAQMFGVPSFAQEDPRIAYSKYFRYNLLLLQSNSFYKKDVTSFNVEWGDFGFAHFFINEIDLENLNFNNILYNWDCY
ncbi:MAG: YwqG family protein [Bacteroidales bacterium]|nr:YwqG family protein [Bacteroidales bacterium]